MFITILKLLKISFCLHFSPILSAMAAQTSYNESGVLPIFFHPKHYNSWRFNKHKQACDTSGGGENLSPGKIAQYLIHNLIHKYLILLSFNIVMYKGGGGRGPNRLDLTVGRFFFLLFGKMSSGWETVEIN